MLVTLAAQCLWRLAYKCMYPYLSAKPVGEFTSPTLTTRQDVAELGVAASNVTST